MLSETCSHLLSISARLDRLHTEALFGTDPKTEINKFPNPVIELEWCLAMDAISTAQHQVAKVAALLEAAEARPNSRTTEPT